MLQCSHRTDGSACNEYPHRSQKIGSSAPSGTRGACVAPACPPVLTASAVVPLLGEVVIVVRMIASGVWCIAHARASRGQFDRFGKFGFGFLIHFVQRIQRSESDVKIPA